MERNTNWTRSLDEPISYSLRGYQRDFHLNYTRLSPERKLLEMPPTSLKKKAAPVLDDLQRCLPVPEVREMIYRLILQPEPDEDTIIVSVYNPAFYYPVRPEEIDLVDDEEADVTFTNPPKPGRKIRCGARSVRLLETCKWLHAEAAALLYRETRFTFESALDSTHFFKTLSRKYLDVIKNVKVLPHLRGNDFFRYFGHSFENVRNLKTLTLPIYSRTYQVAADAKKSGLLIEEMVEIKPLLLLRGLTNITILDPDNIAVAHPKLTAIKTKLDALITKTVKCPKKTYGAPRTTSMDTFKPPRYNLADYVGGMGRTGTF